MLVVSDTSPITNLMQIGQLDLLHNVFNQIIIPQVVYDELSELPSQKIILDQQLWIQVKPVGQSQILELLADELDPGEASAIALALELQANYVIIDELKGRNKAESLGLRIVGLLGTLLKAKQQGFIATIEPLLIDLKEKAGFHIRPDLYDRVLSLAGESN